MDCKMALITGIDIPATEFPLIFHQPTIKEISYIGTKKFFLRVQTLCLDAKMVIKKGDLVSENITNFQMFMKVIQDKNSVEQKQAIQQLFLLMFPQYKTAFTPRAILFTNNDTKEKFSIDDDTYPIFQEYIKTIFCAKESNDSGFNPKDAAAEAIAQKMMSNRERIAAQKNEGDISDVFVIYCSILSVGLQIPITDITENYTMFMLYDGIERLNMRENWTYAKQVQLAGGTVEHPPEYWMSNIH